MICWILKKKKGKTQIRCTGSENPSGFHADVRYLILTSKNAIEVETYIYIYILIVVHLKLSLSSVTTIVWI